LLLLLSSAAPVCEDEEGAADRSANAIDANLRVLQYNTAGVIRNGKVKELDPDKWRFLDVLADRIVDERPQLVTLNELCENQLQRLDELLADRFAMSAVFFPAPLPPGKSSNATKEIDGCDALGVPGLKAPDCRCPDGPHLTGTGMLTAGPSPPVEVPPPGAASANCVLWDHEGQTRVHACVVHVSQEQVPAIGAGMSQWVEDGPVIVAGDFNTRPDSDEIEALYSAKLPVSPMLPEQRAHGRFWEAAQCGDDPACERPKRGGEATAGLVNKFDYIFADDEHFDRAISARVEDTEGQCGGRPCSDHSMLWGDLRLVKGSTEQTPTVPLEERACGELHDSRDDLMTWGYIVERSIYGHRSTVTCDEALAVLQEYLNSDRFPKEIDGWSCADKGGEVYCTRGDTPQTEELMGANVLKCGCRDTGHENTNDWMIIYCFGVEPDPVTIPGCPGVEE
jgi:hypothetical protein